MFEREAKILGDMDILAYELSEYTSAVLQDVNDIHWNIKSLDKADQYDGEVDTLMDWMVDSERGAANKLKVIDKLLNQLIAKRMELGDFTVTLK